MKRPRGCRAAPWAVGNGPQCGAQRLRTWFLCQRSIDTVHGLVLGYVPRPIRIGLVIVGLLDELVPEPHLVLKIKGILTFCSAADRAFHSRLINLLDSARAMPLKSPVANLSEVKKE